MSASGSERQAQGSGSGSSTPGQVPVTFRKACRVPRSKAFFTTLKMAPSTAEASNILLQDTRRCAGSGGSSLSK